MSERYDDILAEIAEIEENAAGLWDRMRKDLKREKPAVDANTIPLPRDPNPVAEPLYSSKRDYLEQLVSYHDWQGK